MRRFERRVVGGSPAARSTFSAWPRSSGLRLLSGSTQVQILPRGLLESESAEARTLFRKQMDRHSPVEAQVLRSPPFSSRSSKAEQSADNRSTAERYRARGPISGGLIPRVGSRGANACGDPFAEGQDLSPPPLPGRLTSRTAVPETANACANHALAATSLSASIGSDAAVS